MKTPLLIGLLLIFGKALEFAVTAQDAQVEGQVAKLLMHLQASALDPDSKLQTAWELGLMGTAAEKSVPALVKILVSPDEHPKARMSALNAVGRIGISEKSVVDQILQGLRDNSKVFGGSGSDAVVNGSFELVQVKNDGTKEKGAFGETMFTPGSLDLVGWTTYAGVTMIQDEGARPGGKNSLELGPRDVPGCISQTILTTIGRTYELKFFMCTGRGFAHFNRQLRLRVADLDRTVDCVVGAAPELIKIPFQATSALTTVTFCGVGNQGFGPMIDEVTIDAADGATPGVSASEGSRGQQLDAIAQRIRAGSGPRNPANQKPPPARVISAETDPGGIALTSEEGRSFVGHQLEFFETTGDGVLSTSKPAWISLYRTEGRDFTLSGEVNLGGAYNQMLFPGDLPDGFALFLREWDGVQRYQLDSRRMMVKRRLLNGQPVSDIQTIVEFSPPPLGEWAPFHVRLSRDVIEYSFAGVVSRLVGPVDIDGANKLTIAPGTRIKNLRLSIDETSDRSPFVDNSPQGPRMIVGPPPPLRPLPQFRQQPPPPRNDLETKMDKVWQLSFENSSNQEAITDLMKLLEDERESPPVRRAALNALGHPGINKESILQSIWRAIEKSPEVFAVSKGHQLLNGGFELPDEAGKVGFGGRPPVGSSFDFAKEGGRGDVRTSAGGGLGEVRGGETMFDPGSVRLPGWSVFEGPITLRDNLPSPTGGRVIELGPRDVPGCISQTIRTAVGQQYKLKFSTCTGRGEFHFNRQIRIRVADLDETIDSPVGAAHERMQRQFRAVSPLTTISICGVGNAGFGPVVDDVQIERK